MLWCFRLSFPGGTLTLPAEPLCLCHELKWFGYSRIPASVSQCSGVTLTPWFNAQERLGHNQIQALSSHGKLRGSQCGDTREDSDLELLQKEKPQLWELFWAGLSQLSCLEWHGDSPAAQKMSSFPCKDSLSLQQGP